MPLTVKKVSRNLAGIFLILLGIVGLFLPVLQGVMFILVGIGLLDFERKTHVLARARRKMTRWGVPRRWLILSRERRRRRVEKRRAKRAERASSDENGRAA